MLIDCDRYHEIILLNRFDKLVESSFKMKKFRKNTSHHFNI
ncbi:hypothetical protein XIS1_1030022 [Xenorhabdus innexi]|uniref:Uncharacterized protein n=1 Tax=Xenorhabdus innexi TaxID=290109 RepID=A0A1N6MQ66_9GAMM|nr:hypothetical protein XIS1_1030022 [Xenorhabdus innexi]